jgi:hypothetical protein
MKPFKKYSIFDREKIVAAIIFLALIIVVTVALTVTFCKGEEALVKVYALCKPGSQVTVRRTPSKGAQEVGFLEVGDDFLTDGTASNGYIRCYGIGEYGEGWVYCGYVTEYEPEPVFETYCCVAKTRVACRRWMNGPKVDRSPWLTNGSNVIVFSIADGWACTSRGYIRAEYLEVDPR